MLSTGFLVGVPVHVVAARLGHADPSITLTVAEVQAVMDACERHPRTACSIVTAMTLL